MTRGASGVARLREDQVRAVMDSWSDDLCRLGLAARDLVLEVAPGLSEKIAFNALCYYKPGLPYGVIAGSACLIGARGGTLILGFLHGAFLPDPDGLLQGRAKAKREMAILSVEALRRPSVAALIRDAVAYDPTA